MENFPIDPVSISISAFLTKEYRENYKSDSFKQINNKWKYILTKFLFLNNSKSFFMYKDSDNGIEFKGLV